MLDGEPPSAAASRVAALETALSATVFDSAITTA